MVSIRILYYQTVLVETEKARQNHPIEQLEEDAYSHNLSRYEQISQFINQLTEKRSELETKIEEQLTSIARVFY